MKIIENQEQATSANFSSPPEIKITPKTETNDRHPDRTDDDKQTSAKIASKKPTSKTIIIILSIVVVALLGAVIFLLGQQSNSSDQQYISLNSPQVEKSEKSEVNQEKVVNNDDSNENASKPVATATPIATTAFVPQMEKAEWVETATTPDCVYFLSQDKFEIEMSQGTAIIEKIVGENHTGNSAQGSNYCGFRLYYNNQLIRTFDACEAKRILDFNTLSNYLFAYSVSPDKKQLALQLIGEANPCIFSDYNNFFVFNEDLQVAKAIYIDDFTTLGWFKNDIFGWLTNTTGFYIEERQSNINYDPKTADLENAGGYGLPWANDANGNNNFIMSPSFFFW